MAEITIRQKKLLEPFGKIFADMDQQVRAMSDEAIQEMLEACCATSMTNCWCCTFAAAQYLQSELRREQFYRKRMRAPAPDAAA